MNFVQMIEYGINNEKYKISEFYSEKKILCKKISPFEKWLW